MAPQSIGAQLGHQPTVVAEVAPVDGAEPQASEPDVPDIADALGVPDTMDAESMFNGLVELYHRGLKVALRHQFTTLLIMLGTIYATGYLYYVIPKGFFPEEDTGMILGIAEAGQDVSFTNMAQRMEAVINVVLQDPAVATVGDQIGPGGSTVAANQARVFIALLPQSQRVSVFQVIRRLQQKLARIQGINPLHAGSAGHYYRRTADAGSVPVHFDRRRWERTPALGANLP